MLWFLYHHSRVCYCPCWSESISKGDWRSFSRSSCSLGSAPDMNNPLCSANHSATLSCCSLFCCFLLRCHPAFPFFTRDVSLMQEFPSELCDSLTSIHNTCTHLSQTRSSERHLNCQFPVREILAGWGRSGHSQRRWRCVQPTQEAVQSLRRPVARQQKHCRCWWWCRGSNRLKWWRGSPPREWKSWHWLWQGRQGHIL